MITNAATRRYLKEAYLYLRQQVLARDLSQFQICERLFELSELNNSFEIFAQISNLLIDSMNEKQLIVKHFTVKTV